MSSREQALRRREGAEVKVSPGPLGLRYPARPDASSGRFQYGTDEVVEKPFNWAQFLRVLSYLRPYRAQVLLALALMLLVAGVRLAAPWVMKLAVDFALAPGNLGRLDMYALIYLGLHIVTYVSMTYRIATTARIGQYAIHDLRHHLFDHIQGLSFDFFDARSVGKVLVRIINDVNSLQDLLSNGVINTLSDVFTLVGIVVIMLTMHWKLSLLTFVLLPFMFLLSTRLRLRIRRAWQQVRVRISNINAHLNESIQGVRMTQAFVQGRPNMRFFAAMNYDNFQTWMRAIRQDSIFGPLVEFTGAVGTGLLFWYGAVLSRAGEVSAGDLVAFMTYVGLFWEPISRLGRMYSSMLVAMASSERIFSFLDTPPIVDDSEEAIVLPRINGLVEFDRVTFAYEEGRAVLHDIDFTAEEGQTIALVGHTGSGKTTITNLIARFYDPTGGSVRIDGYDLRRVTVRSLRRQLAIVLQDPFIFSGTIMDNIRYGRLDATDEEVVAAATAVSAHEFVAALPNGYDTEVRERGSRLSMGQRQLLSFARALLAEPRVLILDEATSSIDTETELLIQRALKTLLRGRTSFVVAHRLSTIRDADRIIVLENGRIIESGTHDELMRHRGTYHSLIQAQFRLLNE